MRKLLLFILSLIIFEIILRLFLSIYFAASFLKPSDIIYTYYPQVKNLKKEYNEDINTKKVLILSSSALTDEWGMFKSNLEKKLNGSKENWQVLNGSGVGFSSLDNLNTYNLLKKHNLKFDFLIYYNAINDARLNNCPKDIFKPDYSHIHWNNEVNCILRNKIIDITVIPFFIDFTFQKAKQKIFTNKFIPDNYKDQPSWKDYGSHFTSIKTFKESLNEIIVNSSQVNLIFSYNYYIPEDYSYEKFINHSLDYNYHENSREIEVWGIPRHVGAFIDTANFEASKIAKKFENTFFFNIKEEMNNPIYFADVCHYSEEGINELKEIVFNTLKTFDD